MLKLEMMHSEDDTEILDAFVQYLELGKLSNARWYIASFLSRQSTPSSRKATLESIFLNGLGDETIRYWSIIGIARVAGNLACEPLSRLALDESIELESRANAINQLALLSNQPFNRGLDRDPGNWKEAQLRTDELRRWIDHGFPLGDGLAPPPRDSSLDQPTTPLESAVSDLDRQLARIRFADPVNETNPANYLTLAGDSDIARIKRRWNLPGNYLEFLTRFSPFNLTCTLRLPRVESDLWLCGAGNLMDEQVGFAIDRETGDNLEDWPQNLVVIGQAFGDPFALDLSRAKGSEAPILTAEHGCGVWEFIEYAPSFLSFLKKIRVRD
ncbi:MAG: hypothetical protein KC777_09915 [Cyanobacteria bacterium HKST-UBA02]|nr:hypothetical protein [Cyanobacteria bacterium HKST-UBA02]